MNGVREWATVICLAALSAAMLQSLVPNGSMERMARFVIGAFIICALVAPISKAVPQIRAGLETENHPAKENERLNSTVDRQFEDAAQQSITGLVHSELKRMGINCKNVQVIMDTDENGSISINKVVVTVDGEAASGRAGVSSALEKTLGIKTEVVSNEG
ncbi:stage III sporulation protein AF [Caproicibacter sp.]|uniref:stage III sporulation protein AF n=1 Tax=Caproicibacter sp. TaxID=2814884 RepID=UPI0039897B1C